MHCTQGTPLKRIHAFIASDAADSRTLSVKERKSLVSCHLVLVNGQEAISKADWACFVFGEFIDPNEFVGVVVNGVEFWK